MIQGFLLAGGDSRRMGRQKSRLTIEGQEAWLHLANKMLAAGCSKVAIAIPAALEKVLAPGLRSESNLELVVIPQAQRQRGAIGSLAHLLTHTGPGFCACLVAPVDHPYVAEDTLSCLLESHGAIRIPTHEGRRGHPIVLEAGPAALVPRLEGTLKTLCRDPGIATVEIPVEDPAILWNLDRPEDYERFGG